MVKVELRCRMKLSGSRALLFLLCVACWQSMLLAAGPTADRNAGPSNDDALLNGPRFEALTVQQSGIDFVQPIDTNHPQKYLYVGGFASAGVALGDLNGDGLQDIFLTGGPVSNRLYLQQPAQASTTEASTADDAALPAGSLKFVDVTRQTGVGGGDFWGAGVSFADIDNDGDLDIYVCNYDAPNQLFINETTAPDQPRFKESAKQFGLDLVDACITSAFCDYDRDGDLDVLVVGYQYIDPAGRPKDLPVIQQGDKYIVKPEFRKYYGVVKGIGGQPTFSNVGRADYLLQNNAADNGGDSDRSIKFTDVTKQAGISGLGVGNSVVWWDYDDDGFPDLYIGNDFKVADQLYRNNGNGTFTDVIRQSVSHTTWFSMGSEAGDINNDGLIDLFITDMAGTSHYRSKVTMGEMGKNRDFLATAEPRQFMRNALMINTGGRRFVDPAYMAGVANTDWSWAAKLADFDNDSWQDIFITNGAARMFNHSDMLVTNKEKIGKTQWELWEHTEPRLEENLVFRNLGDLHFDDASQAWGLKKTSMSYAAAYGDLDNDGDLDLVVTHLDEPVTVYRNATTDQQHYLRVALRGSDSNRFGLGAVVRIETEAGQQMRHMMPMMGFMSCNEPYLHFGLGLETKVNRLRVTWPTGDETELLDIDADQVLTINEDRAVPSTMRRQRRLFQASRSFPALRHVERPYDDFARQPLLPFKHSQLGPGIAVADVDGDGDPDYYLGRASGSRRAVMDNRGNNRLGVKSLTAFEKDTGYEDLGAIFFDADGDGDRDLYVVSGSVECEPNAEALADRLYLNDGQGVFSKAPTSALPRVRESGSVVCAADFDRDGDLDLFVGARLVPGKFPVTPASHLLLNNSKPGSVTFSDATAKLAPQLGATGLVTSALWTDADNDGWIDLMVTHDWGTVKYYRNEPASGGAPDSGRRLVDRTQETQLHLHTGWWNGIAGRDIDHDGDIDYVVTNIGLNTTYHASEEKPELLFYGDFDGTGKPHLVEAKFEDEKCFPRRGLSCSSHAMPFVRKKLPSFHDFGMATLEEVYPQQELSQSLRLAANELRSMVLVNHSNESPDGLPRFEAQPLPTLAQLSPAFGVVLEDFDGDGNVDCFVAQNFFSPQLETGRMDSGVSVLMMGESRGSDDIRFRPLWPHESGIQISGDAKSVAVVDFNEDGWSDLLVTANNGTIEAYEFAARNKHRRLRVKLEGLPGNPDATGSRVSVAFADGSSQTAEVSTGGGYLSQGQAWLMFGNGAAQAAATVTVRWPDGTSDSVEVPADQTTLELRQQK